MAEPEKKEPLNTDVSSGTKRFLEEAKKDGHAKGDVVDEAVAFWRFLCYSQYDLKTTKEQVMLYRSLKRMREKLAEQGLGPTTLAGLDNAISFQRNILKKLETGEFKK